jgi:hypothetical protein
MQNKLLRTPRGAALKGRMRRRFEARSGMVNGYLPSSLRAEDFAGYGPGEGGFCLPGATRHAR